ncbi:MAG: ClpXP protease specificity-enhancing factor SspB [Hyphomicrobiales bacterium]|nr:ClpXP protease specificity-enhancing factor SspB [Hyphomicrobiales bacterium]
MSNKAPRSFAINYNAFTKRALRGVIRDALAQVAEQGLPDDHHFYIRFDTTREGVVLPEKLRNAYPEHMTIVVQHQYEDLVVGKKDFSITLSFQKHLQRLTVPFDAIQDFTDPAASFRLQFTPVKKETPAEEAAGKKPAVRVEESSEESSILHVDFPQHRRPDEPNSSA